MLKGVKVNILTTIFVIAVYTPAYTPIDVISRSHAVSKRPRKVELPIIKQEKDFQDILIKQDYALKVCEKLSVDDIRDKYYNIVADIVSRFGRNPDKLSALIGSADRWLLSICKLVKVNNIECNDIRRAVLSEFFDDSVFE